MPSALSEQPLNQELVRSLSRFLGAAFWAAVSVVAAFTLRFLILGVAAGPAASNGSSYVDYSILAMRHLLLPGLIVGAIVFALYELFSGVFARRKVPSHPFYACLAFLLFFALMYLAGLWLPEGYVFPRRSLIPAALICVAGFLSYDFTRRLAPGERLPIPYTRTTQFVIDVLVIGTGLFLSYLVRFDGQLPARFFEQSLFVGPYVVAIYVLFLLLWNVHARMWRFTSFQDVLVIGQAVASAALALLLARILLLNSYPSVSIPYGVLVIEPIVTWVGLIGVRGLRRVQYGYSRREKTRPKAERIRSPRKRRALLVGAGQAGLMLVRELERRSDFEILGFLDDDLAKLRRRVGGVRVLGTTRDLRRVVAATGASEVVFSMPSAPKATLRRVAADCEKLGVRVSSVPSLTEIVLGKIRVGQLRPVRMEDLLGRDSIEFPAGDAELVSTYRGKRILVTGAAGSIGSELARQLKDFQPEDLVLLDKDENSLYEVGLELRESTDTRVVEVMADVRDRVRLDRVFARYRPQVVFHAAAYKHVPMMEYHPTEAIQNNVFGTERVLEAAARHGVGFFLLISTDKAVNPTSVMGASKRVAEMLVRRQAGQPNPMRCCCVRFGNVLGSRASVVPLFQKRIQNGRNIQVTHPDIRRYFMTIPEAVQLVIQAGSLAGRGETFVLDMGDPVRIVDLARDLIEQSGLVLGEDIEIEFTGLRPGEKLFEELLLDAEKVRSTKYPKIFVDRFIEENSTELENALSGFRTAVESGADDRIREIFERLQIGYQRKVIPLAPSAEA